MISLLVKSDTFSLQVMGLSQRRVEQPGPTLLPSARRIPVSGAAQQHEAKLEYSRVTRHAPILPAKNFFPDSNEGVVTNNQ